MHDVVERLAVAQQRANERHFSVVVDEGRTGVLRTLARLFLVCYTCCHWNHPFRPPESSVDTVIQAAFCFPGAWRAAKKSQGTPAPCLLSPNKWALKEGSQTFPVPVLYQKSGFTTTREKRGTFVLTRGCGSTASDTASGQKRRGRLARGSAVPGACQRGRMVSW